MGKKGQMSSRVCRHAPTVRSHELGDELTLFDTATGRAVALNGTARDIWALVDGQSGVHEIVQTLARAYRVEPEHIAADVETAVTQLQEAEVLLPAER
jgi:Coenzyme PQQ synthesis protein D (PqqD)